MAKARKWIKTIWLFTILVFMYSNKKATGQEPYLPEYEQYRQPVAARIDSMDKTMADSAGIILDKYLHDIAVYSCTWCVVEIPAFQPVAGFVKRHPESLIFVLHRSLSGNGLTWGFRVLFKEYYPAQYRQLLKQAKIVLHPENELSTESQRWHNKVKEFSLHYTLLAGEYLRIISRR